MTPTLVLVFSDPQTKAEESLGRVFNALALVYDLRERGQKAKLIFQGTGTRWPTLLSSADHPLHSLYVKVLDDIEGVCGGCADVFGARDNIEKLSIPLLRDFKLPGTNGLTSIASFINEGYRVINF